MMIQESFHMLSNTRQAASCYMDLSTVHSMKSTVTNITQIKEFKCQQNVKNDTIPNSTIKGDNGQHN